MNTMKLVNEFNRGALVLAGAIFSGTLFAATDTTTFTVTATVADSCSVAATDLAFGSITPVDNIDFDNTSTVTVTCSNGTSYDTGLNEGSNSSDTTVNTRRMSDGVTSFLSYQLYSDSGRTTVWGDTVSTDTVAGTGDGTGQGFTVYGRVPSGQQTVSTGSYSDTVTVTVTF